MPCLVCLFSNGSTQTPSFPIGFKSQKEKRGQTFLIWDRIECWPNSAAQFANRCAIWNCKLRDWAIPLDLYPLTSLPLCVCVRPSKKSMLAERETQRRCWNRWQPSVRWSNRIYTAGRLNTNLLLSLSRFLSLFPCNTNSSGSTKL